MRPASVFALFALSAFSVCGQAVVDGFTLQQIDFTAQHTGNIPCSEYGHAGFAVRQVPGITQYVQVTAQLSGSSTPPAWIVRNVPAVASILSTSTNVNLKLLGIQRGTCVTGAKLNYTISVTSSRLTTAPAFIGTGTTFIGQRTDRAEGVAATDTGVPGLPPAADSPGEMALALFAVRAAGDESGDLSATIMQSPGMGNIIQKTNECAPAAVANSMYWLQSKGAIDLKGDSVAQTMTKLKSDVKFDISYGSKPADIIAGKIRFAQRTEHPLDLEIHYQTATEITGVGDSVTVGTGTAIRDPGSSAPTLAYIQNEVRKGQDVEISVRWLKFQGNNPAEIDGGHALAVSGVAVNSDANGVYTNDDSAQNGSSLGLRTNHFSEVGDAFYKDRTYAGLFGLPPNFIDTVYSESPKPRYMVYIPREIANNVAAFSLEPPPYMTPGRSAADLRAATGGLTEVSGSPLTAGQLAVAAATALDRFLYVANYGGNSVSAYKIDQNSGALSLITGSPYAVGTNPFSAVVDPTGRLLYVANYGGSSISAFRIDPTTGQLTPIPGSPFSTGAVPVSLAISPSGRLLYAATNAGVYAYVMDVPTGVLTVVTGSPFAAGANPNAVTVHPTGRFVYVVNTAFSTTNGSVSVYRVGQTGALTPVPGSPFKPGTQPSDIAIDPLGKFAYVSNFTSNTVSGFSINTSTGALTPVLGSPFTVPAGPFAMGIEPVGNYLYVSSQGNNPGSISVFSISPGNGTLVPISGSPFPGGAGPAKMAFAAIQPYVLTVNPVPALSQLAPSGATPGAGVTVVSVYGTNFAPGATVRWNGAARYTVFESSTLLNVAIPASDLAAPGTANITVSNLNGGSSASLPFTISASQTLPSVPGNGTLNDAGFTIGQPVAAGSIATSFGAGLATGITPLNSPPSNLLLGSSMKIDGITAPYYFVSPGQVVFQVPWELADQDRALATFTTATGTGAPATVTLAPFAPGIFTMNGAGQGAVVINATGELTGPVGAVPGFPTRAAARGEYIAIFCTGLGDVTNRPATGAPASLDASSLSLTKTNPSVTIGSAVATPVFSGLAPGYVGLYQVVVQVPAGAPSGTAVPLSLSIGGQKSNTVTIAVQ